MYRIAHPRSSCKLTFPHLKHSSALLRLLIFVILAIISIGYDNIVLIKLKAEIWDHSHNKERARQFTHIIWITLFGGKTKHEPSCSVMVNINVIVSNPLLQGKIMHVHISKVGQSCTQKSVSKVWWTFTTYISANACTLFSFLRVCFFIVTTWIQSQPH